MARLPKPLDPAVRRELQHSSDGRKAIASFERKRKTDLDKNFPEPSEHDVEATVTWLQNRFDSLHNGIGSPYSTATTSVAAPSVRTGSDQVAGINGVRDVRYHRDQLPPKWQDQLEGATRIRSNLSNTEIGNARGLLGRNPIKVSIPPIGSLSNAVERANHEQRWCDSLPAALERETGHPLIQEVDDALVEGGICAVEVYLTDAYDGIDFNQTKATGDLAGDALEETDAEYASRVEAELMTCGLPFGVRPVDPLSLLFDRDQYGVYVAVVSERKPYRVVFDDIRKKMTPKQFKSRNYPEPWSEGVAERYTDYTGEGMVLTRKYYDRRWYVYMVGSEIVEVKEHGMPGVPVLIGYGWVTSSPTLGEKYQGVTWGMVGLERALNDRLTLDFDVQVTYSRPLPYIESAVGAQMIMEQGTNRAKVLDLTRGVIQLNPGQQLKDATASFKVQRTEGLDILMGLFTRSGMNPVAQGESPGTDPSGYAINALQNSAQSRYKPFMDGKQRFWGNVFDFVRLVVRDVVAEDVYITAPMDDANPNSGLEWMKYGPDDVTETPCTVYVDPLDDTNRAAIAAWLGNGVDRGLVPEEELMKRGYGAQSTSEWYRAIDLDAIRRALRSRAVQETLATIDAEAQAQQGTVPQLLGPDGQPLPPSTAGMAQDQQDGGPGSVQDSGNPEDYAAPTVGKPAAVDSGRGYTVTDRRRRATMPSAQIAGSRPVSQGVSTTEATAGR